MEDHSVGRGVDYEEWYVGITGRDPEVRKGEHLLDDYPKLTDWESWEHSNPDEIENLERYYTKEKHTRGGTGGSKNPTHIYAFKHLE